MDYELNEYDFQYIEEYNKANEHPLNIETFIQIIQNFEKVAHNLPTVEFSTKVDVE